ncbi:MAG: hypothetical protein OES12_06060 [Anaerolineae bacterium]|nr:hypothetical protein [Anaerolineae bacterium]
MCEILTATSAQMYTTAASPHVNVTRVLHRPKVTLDRVIEQEREVFKRKAGYVRRWYLSDAWSIKT